MPNIHYGATGKLIDVKSPCNSGKVSQFINQSLKKPTNEIVQDS